MAGAGPISADSVEVFDPLWVTPGEALQRAERDEWFIEFPTKKHLEQLCGFRHPDEVIHHAGSTGPVERIEPRVIVADDGSWTVVLPGEPGYEEALG